MIFLFSFSVDCIIISLISYFLKDKLVTIFTTDGRLIELTNMQIQVFLFVCFFDFL